MPLTEFVNFLSERSPRSAYSQKLLDRISEVVKATWYLGFTAFGGPPVHFQIFHKKFVEEKDGRTPWIDEQTYQELFALCQALPGPGSTKFLFATVLVHAGWIPAILAFLIWSLPGAVGMFALSLGVQQISDTLPEPAYAFLSGLNASTVGIIAVAAVQLAEKCIKDRLSRILVIFGATAGLCYSTLWYYPVLVISGGLTCALWDLRLAREVRKLKQAWEARRRRAADQAAAAEDEATEHPSDPAPDGSRSIELRTPEPAAGPKHDSGMVQRRQAQPREVSARSIDASAESNADSGIAPATHQQSSASSGLQYGVSVRLGLLVLAVFVVSFVVVLTTRAELAQDYRPLSLFANMYLAGTIIFGGGPVVIPLLREYVVSPGWVSPRDFLIGLAIIQAFPGPNFNFSVYLGALAVASSGAANSFLGAVLGYVGIFLPGLVFAIASQGLWRKLRTRPLFLALLRGINATAVGLVFTAVYRLWEVGYLTNESTSNIDAAQGGRVSGRSLADEPWWVVVAAVTYSGNKWFNVPAAISIAAGGVLGLAWWGVTQQ
ncbi:hypothetical protein PMZ80_006109 [Knufia obscura]|uniref:Chromate ion transporter n=1 Tax=Knufia obscura TaxID=1635080 RepID=A0ABR0RPJ3_9EURO|nr:hypothetical protein PMZ80_006109 [Knufia obscura]